MDGRPELEDAFIDGNKLGVAFGSYSSYATEMKGDSDPDDENFAIEGLLRLSSLRQHHRDTCNLLD